MRPLPQLSVSVQMLFSSVAMHSSSAAPCNLRPAWSSLRATASAPAVNLQAVLNRLTGLTIIAFIQKIGSRGSDPRLLGLTMGWHLDRTCGERPPCIKIEPNPEGYQPSITQTLYSGK